MVESMVPYSTLIYVKCIVTENYFSDFNINGMFHYTNL